MSKDWNHTPSKSEIIIVNFTAQLSSAPVNINCLQYITFPGHMALAEIIIVYERKKENWEPFRVPDGYRELFPGHIWHKQIENIYQ